MSTDIDERRLRVDAWVDVACPWCYVGKKRLETAIEQSGHGNNVDLVLHTFELDPAAPDSPVSNPQYVARHMGVTVQKAVELEERMQGLAAVEALDFTVDRIHARSLGALRLVHLAAAHGVAYTFFSAVQHALFTGRADTYDRAFLLKTAVASGVPDVEAAEVLDGDQYADAVEADRAQALQLGARGVPFTVIGEKYAVPGVISTNAYRDALETAWNEL